MEATTTNLKGISTSYTFVTLCKMCGRLKKIPYVNKKTGDKFSSLVFPDQHTDPYTNQPILTPEGKQGWLTVNFSQKLGELTPAQLNAQRHELQVVRLTTGKYKLCKQGEVQGEDVIITLD